MTIRQMTAFVLAFALVFASCGGGDDGSEPTTTAAGGSETTTTALDTTEAPAATTAPPETEPPSDDGETPSGDANKATVTVGDTTYEFDVEASIVGRCDPDFFGAFWVIAAATDGTNGSLEMFIIPEGNTNHDETSKIKVNAKDSDERDWRADADGGEGTPEGESSVDSFEIDGNTVTGTASFVDIYAGDGATAQGTFTATCP